MYVFNIYLVKRVEKLDGCEGKRGRGNGRGRGRERKGKEKGNGEGEVEGEGEGEEKGKRTRREGRAQPKIKGRKEGRWAERLRMNK